MSEHEGHSGMQKENSGSSNSSMIHNNKIKRIAVSNTFQKQLDEVFEAYIEVKNALVDDNVENAQKAAQKTKENLAKVDMKELKEKEAHKRWMNIHKKLNTAADGIANSTELKEQRDYFDELSDNMTLGIQSFGINKKVYYSIAQ